MGSWIFLKNEAPMAESLQGFRFPSQAKIGMTKVKRGEGIGGPQLQSVLASLYRLVVLRHDVHAIKEHRLDRFLPRP